MNQTPRTYPPKDIQGFYEALGFRGTPTYDQVRGIRKILESLNPPSKLRLTKKQFESLKLKPSEQRAADALPADPSSNSTESQPGTKAGLEGFEELTESSNFAGVYYGVSILLRLSYQIVQ